MFIFPNKNNNTDVHFRTNEKQQDYNEKNGTIDMMEQIIKEHYITLLLHFERTSVLKCNAKIDRTQ